MYLKLKHDGTDGFNSSGSVWDLQQSEFAAECCLN